MTHEDQHNPGAPHLRLSAARFRAVGATVLDQIARRGGKVEPRKAVVLSDELGRGRLQIFASAAFTDPGGTLILQPFLPFAVSEFSSTFQWSFFMPRKSANQVAIESAAERVGAVAPWNHERPDPPADMSEAQAAIWRAVVSAMRPGWFSRETHDQLARYCHAMAECARLEAELVRIGVESEVYDRMSKRRNATAASALSYARALRITPHSNKYNLVKGRDPGRSLFRRPWEGGDGGDGGELRKPWEDS